MRREKDLLRCLTCSAVDDGKAALRMQELRDRIVSFQRERRTDYLIKATASLDRARWPVDALYGAIAYALEKIDLAPLAEGFSEIQVKPNGLVECPE